MIGALFGILVAAAILTWAYLAVTGGTDAADFRQYRGFNHHTEKPRF